MKSHEEQENNKTDALKQLLLRSTLINFVKVCLSEEGE